MGRRSGMQPVYVGDVGNIHPVRSQIDVDLLMSVDIDALEGPQILRLALQAGVDIRDLIGVNRCIQHYELVLLQDRKLPDGYNYLEDVTYCRNCFQYFRVKWKPVQNDGK